MTKIQKNITTSKEKALNLNDFMEHTNNLLNESKFETLPNGNLKQQHISDEIFQDLPELLKIGVNAFSDLIDKEVFLYGAFGCLSAIMTNVRGWYGKGFYTPHLYIYIVGSAGSGKGTLKHSKALVYPLIENFIKEVTQDSDKPSKRLFIPANTSSRGAFDLLANNDGNGLIFETEGDTLANVFKSDFGNYSDSFRKAFGHETISLYRATDKIDVSINNPRLATVLSSTFGQILNLIPSAENGLFSRFLFFEVTPSDEWKNPFAKEDNNFSDIFDGLSNRCLQMYQQINKYAAITVKLTDTQHEFFNTTFSTWKREIRGLLGQNEKDDLDGTIHRLGLMTFRLAMIFTILRNFDDKTLSDDLVCTDKDFYNAFRIIQVSKNNALAIYTRLPKPKYYDTEGSNKFVDKADKMERAKYLISQDPNMSYSKIALEVFGDVNKKSTIVSWLGKKT